MRRTLYIKIVLGYIIFGIAAFVIVANFVSRYNQKYLERKTASDLYKEAALIADNYADSYFSTNLTLQQFHQQLYVLGTYLNGDILVVNPEGEILVDSREETDPDHLEKIDGFDIMKFGSSYYAKGTLFGHYDSTRMSVYASVTNNYRLRGYVIINVPLTNISVMQNGLLNGIYLSLLIFFCLSLLVLVIFTLNVYRPINKIIKAAVEYNLGNYEKELVLHRRDEIGYIGATMGYMANELNTLEEDQRKFISNISHDFRSPLTSIGGYAQAMADGTIPVEMQEKYLNVIVFETQRLEKLTQSLLDLNKFGSKGMYMDMSHFDINRTIRRTVQTFEGVSRERQISFELIFSGQELYVYADAGKIDRVIHNLIDNAVKFSHPGGTIQIETTERKEKAYVSVKDAGIGIPKDSIKKIWDRFYKTDLSRGKDKKGTGLGLSIVKEIITAHKENIDVISTEGVGTEFIFTLPLGQKREDS